MVCELYVMFRHQARVFRQSVDPLVALGEIEVALGEVTSTLKQ
jgi:hypothetical protein